MTELGIGVGWRPEIAGAVEALPGVDWVEVVAENLCAGHLPDSLARLRSRGVTVVPHGVSLGLGGADRPDAGRLAELAAKATALGAPLVTEHIAFVRAGGPLTATPVLEAGHLLPVPRTWDALDVLCENVRIAQDALPVPLALENIAALISWPGEELTEGQFLAELVERTGVRLLIDVANLHTNHVNRGEDPSKALSELPVEAIAYVHVAGGLERDGVWHDTHAHPVPPAVLAVLSDLASRVSPPGVLLERDDHFPPAEELAAELTAIRATLAAAGAPRGGSAAPEPGAPGRAAAAEAVPRRGGVAEAVPRRGGVAPEAGSPDHGGIAPEPRTPRRGAAAKAVPRAERPLLIGAGARASGGPMPQPPAAPATSAQHSLVEPTRPGGPAPGADTRDASHPRAPERHHQAAPAEPTRPGRPAPGAGARGASHPRAPERHQQSAAGENAPAAGDGARGRVAVVEAALLSALVAGTPAPEGFDTRRLGVQSRALAAKRADVVAKVAPELPEILGDGYRPAFLAYARSRPMTGGYRRDALDFVEQLLVAGRPEDPEARRRLTHWWQDRSGSRPPGRATRLARAARAALVRR
ncbi:DUF692 family multinuclear iron-containing protein [Streptomyces sp. NPDC006551]|uniref:multinuclear nonheme iron-dependent oxidase n=1 Tax=Streptomyces sp. NPDC006551 TaxID=3157178 RepID=UPI0033A2A329